VPFESILVKKTDGIGWVVFNRPEKLKVITRRAPAELRRAFLEERKPTWSGK